MIGNGDMGRLFDPFGGTTYVFENYNSEGGDPLYGKRLEMISWNAACLVDLFLRLYQTHDGLR
jgi:hypothetical protein